MLPFHVSVCLCACVPTYVCARALVSFRWPSHPLRFIRMSARTHAVDSVSITCLARGFVRSLVCLRVFAYIYVYVCVCVCVFARLCICVFVYLCMYVLILGRGKQTYCVRWRAGVAV